MEASVQQQVNAVGVQARAQQESRERQQNARDTVVEERREASTSSENVESINAAANSVNFTLDSCITSLLKKLVDKLVDSENAHYALEKRLSTLCSNQAEGHVPLGMKIKTVVAKGKDIEGRQSKLDNILKKAEA